MAFSFLSFFNCVLGCAYIKAIYYYDSQYYELYIYRNPVNSLLRYLTPPSTPARDPRAHP